MRIINYKVQNFSTTASLFRYDRKDEEQSKWPMPSLMEGAVLTQISKISLLRYAPIEMTARGKGSANEHGDVSTGST